jgi:aryl-alcohol dehydrogenase-like predicted oxidoreductase
MDLSDSRRVLGRTGLQVSRIGLGAAELGFERASDKVTDALIGAAIEAGINVVDTAAMYSDSEQKIGKALKGRRDKVLLFTKCGLFPPPRRSTLGFVLRSQRQIKRALGLLRAGDSLEWHPRALEWDINESLRRMNTDYLDLIQLHSCSEEILRDGGVIEVLQKARAAGKVRHIGYSSDGKATSYAIQTGVFESVQVAVNIADQQPIDEALPLASKYGIGVIVKRALANCLWKRSERPAAGHYQAYWDRLQALKYEFLGGTCPTDIALRFVLSLPGIHTVLVGTTSPLHLKQDVELVGKALSAQEFQSIRSRWREVAQPDWHEQV